jgi:hypothetical protein
MPKEKVMEQKMVKETNPRVANVKYQLSVGGEVFEGLTDAEVRAKLKEIDPDGKLETTDYRVKEM